MGSLYVSLALLPVLTFAILPLDPEILFCIRLKWPRQGFLTVLSFIGILTSLLINLKYMSDSLQLGIAIIMYVEVAAFWSLPNFIVQILLENLMDTKSNFWESSKKFIDNYEKLEQSLKFYFFLVFFPSQLVIIFQVFNIYWMSGGFKVGSLYVVSYILSLTFMIMNLISITNSVSETESRLRELKREVEGRLLSSKIEEETKQLEYCRSMAELLKPMNAGYFDINKTTLTSMLSVRYKNNKQN